MKTVIFSLISSMVLLALIQSNSCLLSFFVLAKGWILYILLEIRRMLIEYPGYYFYAELYLDDYIVWLQKSARLVALFHIIALLLLWMCFGSLILVWVTG